MGQRLQLHEVFADILETDNVYFQPPNNLKMQYPCIVYNLDDIDAEFADNTPYALTKRYSVTIIDRNPDTLLVKKIASLPMCIFNRFFTADNLNHYVFLLHY